MRDCWMGIINYKNRIMNRVSGAKAACKGPVHTTDR